MSILAPQKYIDNKEEVLFARSPIPNFMNYRRRRSSKKSDDEAKVEAALDDTSFDFDDSFDFAKFVRTHGHRIDHMIKKCRWKSQPCGPDNFTAVITEFGLCYTFNSGLQNHPPLKVQRAGVDYGLRLQLSVQQDQYYGSLRDSSGFKVMVHEQEEPPLINELGFAIQPGTHTFCGLRKEVVRCLTIQYNTIQYNTIQYNTIQYNTIQYNTIQYNTIQYNTIQYNTIQYNTTQHNTTQYNTIQCNAIQCNTMQYNTIQYNTIQYNTIQ